MIWPLQLQSADRAVLLPIVFDSPLIQCEREHGPQTDSMGARQ